MRHRPVLAAFLLFAAMLPFVAQAQDEDAERLRIHGSNLLGDRLVPALVDAWLRRIGYGQLSRRSLRADRMEIRAVRDGAPLIVEIDKRGTHAGLMDLAQGEAEIAMTTRPPNAAERDAAWQLGDLSSPGQEWVLGLEGVAVVVAPGNPVQTLSVAQVRQVLAGRVRDWRELGGIAGPIHVHSIAAQTGTGELLRSVVMDGAPLGATVRTHGRFDAITAAVQADPLAIGIIGARAPRDGLRALAIRRDAQSMAFAPDRLAVAAEDYPLQRRVYFHTGQLITALGRGFAEFALSAEGQALVERSALVSLAVQPANVGPDPAAPGEYRQLVAGAQRLSMNLRFARSGFDLLDSRARQDLARLASYLRQPRNARRRVMVLGFANPQADVPYLSLSRSQDRADYLSSELLALDIPVVSVRGFGGSRRLVDAAAPDARYVNERIEVWLR